MGLDGPAREIIVEPQKQPERIPEPAPAVSPPREAPVPERERREKVPA